MAAPGFHKPPIIIEPQIIEIHKLKPKRNRPGFELALMATSNVSCRCGATHERTEFHSAPRKLNRFDSHACGHTLEIFSDVNGPSFHRLPATLRCQRPRRCPAR